jgi:hypothetical protein
VSTVRILRQTACNYVLYCRFVILYGPEFSSNCHFRRRTYSFLAELWTLLKCEANKWFVNNVLGPSLQLCVRDIRRVQARWKRDFHRKSRSTFLRDYPALASVSLHAQSHKNTLKR